jgi:peptidylprolyl isomerase
VNIINTSKAKISSFNEEMKKIEDAKKETDDRREKVAKETAKAMQALKAQAEELPSGVKVYFNHRGKGQKPNEGDKVLMNYAGYLANGALFDSNIRETEEKYEMLNPDKVARNGYAPMPSDYSKDAALIPGFREGLLLLSVGDTATLFIPSHLAYGESGAGGVIPPNADLIFELSIVDIVKK